MKKDLLFNQLKYHQRRLQVLFAAITLLSAVFVKQSAFAQQTRQVSGRVTTTDGAPLPGVSVKVRGTTIGITTDAAGNYRLSVPDEATLLFSFVGYVNQQVGISAGTSVYNIRLAPTISALNEVVVVGYGSTPRKDLTGSVSSVNANTTISTPTASIDQALQGRAAGVQVTNNDGAPGNGVNVVIRGIGSLTSNDPLYVVDGYPISGGINNINPYDIATMDILKDASATAIYGVRAAGGVVIITTKRGNKNGTQISLDAYASIQSKPKEFKVLNAQQWATLANQDKATEGTFQELPEWSNPSALTNVDWQNAIYRPGLRQNYNLGIRGGNEKVQSAFSLGYFDQKGTVLASYFKRINLSVNVDFTPLPWLKSSTSAKYSRQDQNNPFGTGALQQLSELIPTITGNSFTNLASDGKGNYGFYNPINIYTKSWGNPVYTLHTNDYKNLNNYFLANTSLEATIIDGLKIKTNVGANVSDFSGYFFQPQDNRSQDQYNLGGPSQLSVYSQNASNTFEWLVENTISYNKTFGQHNISFVGGVSDQLNTFRQIGGTGNNLPSNALRDLGQVSNLTAYGNQTTYSLASQFARLSYKFADKYLITGTVRRDGSSKFDKGHQYGVFPSVAVAWKLKEESFLKNAAWLTDLKLRGSYGQIGNQGSIPTFGYASLYSSGGPATSGTNFGYPFGKNGTVNPSGTYQGGIAPVQPENARLKWETDNVTDVGADLAFLNGDLAITADYYNKQSRDFLLALVPAAQTGYSNALSQNAGSISNKGFEFAVNYNNHIGEFKYGIGLTATTVNNKLLSITKTVNFIDNLNFVNGLGANGWGQFSETNIGQPIGEFFGYKSLGIFQTQAQIDALNAKAAVLHPSNPYYQKSTTQPGDRYYADVNGDGQITPSDRTSLGSPIPKVYGGLNIDIAYKNFDFNAYFYGSFGNKIFNYQERNLESFQAPGFVGVENVSQTYYANHWTPTNPSNRYARLTYNDDVSANNVPSSQYVEDGSYVRLRNVTLGYTLPTDLTKRVSISRLRIYVSVQNLFTITKYSGLDPEIGLPVGTNVQTGLAQASATASGIDSGTYPSSRFYTVGLNVTF